MPLRPTTSSSSLGTVRSSRAGRSSCGRTTPRDCKLDLSAGARRAAGALGRLVFEGPDPPGGGLGNLNSGIIAIHFQFTAYRVDALSFRRSDVDRPSCRLAGLLDPPIAYLPRLQTKLLV